MKMHGSGCLSAFLLLATSLLVPAQAPSLPFDAPVVLGDAQTRFRAALDYDADGNVDFVSVGFPSDNLLVVKGYRGDGAGNLLIDWSVTYPITPLGTNNEPPAPIAAGDFNGDGLSDFVLAVQDVVGYWLSNGAGAVPYVTWVWQEPALIDEVLTADFDGDGLSDVLLQQGNQVRIYLTQTAGPPPVLASSATFGPSVYGTRAFLLEANGDGTPDVGLLVNSAPTAQLRLHPVGTANASGG